MQFVHPDLFAELTDLFRKKGIEFAMKGGESSAEDVADHIAAEIALLCDAGETGLGLEIVEASEKYALSSARLDEARAELLWRGDQPEQALAIWERLGTRDEWGLQCVRELSASIELKKLDARLSAISKTSRWIWSEGGAAIEKGPGDWLVEQIEICRAAGRRDVSAVLICEIAAAANEALAAMIVDSENPETTAHSGFCLEEAGGAFSFDADASPAPVSLNPGAVLQALRVVCLNSGVTSNYLAPAGADGLDLSASELTVSVLHEAIALRDKGRADISLALIDRAIANGLDSIWIRDNRIRALIALGLFEEADRALRALVKDFDAAPETASIASELENIIKANGLTKADIEEINDYLSARAQPAFFMPGEIERGMGKVELNALLARLVDDDKESLAFPVLRALFSKGKSTPYLIETFVRAIRKKGLDLSSELFGLRDSAEVEEAGARSVGDGTSEEGTAAIFSVLVHCGYEGLLSPADLEFRRGGERGLRDALRARTQEALHSELYKELIDEAKARLLIDCLATYLGDSAAERDLNICRLYLSLQRPAEARALAETRLFGSDLKQAFREIVSDSLLLEKILAVKSAIRALSFYHLLPAHLGSALASARTLKSLIHAGLQAIDHANHAFDIDASLQLLGVFESEMEGAPTLIECRARILMSRRRYREAAQVLRDHSVLLDGEQRGRFHELMQECEENLRIRGVYERIEAVMKAPLSREMAAEAWGALFSARGEKKSLIRLREKFSQGMAYYGARTLELTKSLSDPGAIFEAPGFSDTHLAPLLLQESGRSYKDFFPAHESFDIGPMPHNPLVSVIIVAYQSAGDLMRLLPTLQSQSYQNFEVILIDNGVDDSQRVLEGHFPDHKYRKEDNVGFAKANNIGLDLAEGELILLLNPDTKLDRHTLSELVEALRIDGTAAVAVPKIHFDGRFANLRIEVADSSVALVRESLTKGASYRKSFIRQGRVSEDGLIHPVDGAISVDLPTPEQTIQIDLRFVFCSATPHAFDVAISVTGAQRVVRRIDEKGVLLISWGARQEGAFHIINNAGSAFSETGDPFDRGFGQRDQGQFDSRAYVDALCGCCALIRRPVFLRRKVFVPYFFAYYEDSELSYWLKQNGLRILYVPSARIEHRHSESTTEFSPLWRMLVGRSGLLFKSLKDQVTLNKNSFSVIENLYRSFGAKYPALVERLRGFDDQAKAQDIAAAVNAPRISVAIYNSYFSTKGGGERHCLELAARISQAPNVDLYLIAEQDFSIETLGSFFEIDLSRCRKLVMGRVASCITAFFDVFINSTYMSNVVSHARASFFITSFPCERVERDFLASYVFLHNSPFTAAWANAFWGEHRSLTLLPIIGFDARKPALARKKRVILNVGRFNYGGHCKNQHLILAAFIALRKTGALGEDWSLRLIGSVDETSPTSIRHYEDVREMAKGYNVEIHANADAEFVRQSYAEAAIYCHATGCGLLETDDPALHEHFGIAVFEALMNGCVPCVASTAGPLAMTRGLDAAFYFSNEGEIERALLQATRLAQNASASSKAQRAIRARAEEFLKLNVRSVDLIVDLVELAFAKDTTSSPPLASILPISAHLSTVSTVAREHLVP